MTIPNVSHGDVATEAWADAVADQLNAIPSSYTSDYLPRAGAWQAAPNVNTGAAGVLVLDTVVYVPVLFAAGTLVELAIEVTIAGAGSTYRLGLYSPTTLGIPGVRLLDAGTVNTAATGVKTVVISQAVSGLTYLAAVPQGGVAPTIKWIAAAAAPSGNARRMYFTSAAWALQPNISTYLQAGVAGALPTPAVPGASGGSVPQIAFKWA